MEGWKGHRGEEERLGVGVYLLLYLGSYYLINCIFITCSHNEIKRDLQF